METKQEEVIEVLTAEIIDSLGEDVAKDFNELSEMVPANKLLKLNPVIVELSNIVKLADIKYDPENEKESVQQFKDAKKSIGAFNSKTKAAKQEGKAKILEAGRKWDSIEKRLLQEAAKVKDKIFETFKPYLDAQAKKKAAAEKKKEDERNKALKEANEKVDEAVAKANLAGAYNKVKYDTVVEFFSRMSSEFINLNVGALGLKKSSLENQKLSDLLVSPEQKEAYDLLSDEQQMEVVTLYKEKKKDAIRVATERLTLLEKEENEKLNLASEKGKIEAKSEPVIEPKIHYGTGGSVSAIPAPPKEVFELKNFAEDFKKQKTVLDEMEKYFRAYAENSIYPMAFRMNCGDVSNAIKDASDEMLNIIKE